MGAMVTGRVGPGAFADARGIGIHSVLDYTQEIPASLQQKLDIVFDCNGSLSSAEGDMLRRDTFPRVNIVIWLLLHSIQICPT
jgi:hypothetical protein